MKRRLQFVLDGLKTVFRRPGNVATAAVFAFIGLFAAIWITNLPLLGEVLFGDAFPFASRLEILATSFGAIESNFHVFSRTVTILIVTLFGVNTAMALHYLKGRFALDRSAGTGFVGTVFGMLGVGCASCGSIIASSVLGTAVVGILPFRGLEFGLIGILILSFSIYLTAKRISEPEVCAF